MPNRPAACCVFLCLLQIFVLPAHAQQRSQSLSAVEAMATVCPQAPRSLPPVATHPSAQSIHFLPGRLPDQSNSFESALSFYKEGIEQFKATNYQACAELLEKALAISPRPDFYQALGITLAKNNDLPGAEGAFRKGLALDPTNWCLWRNLSRVLYGLGKDEEAQMAMNYAMQNHQGEAPSEILTKSRSSIATRKTHVFPSAASPVAESASAGAPGWSSPAPVSSPSAAQDTSCVAPVASVPATSYGAIFSSPESTAGSASVEGSAQDAFDRLIAAEQAFQATSLPAKDFPGTGQYKDWAEASKLYNAANSLRKAGRFKEAIESYERAIKIYPYDCDFFHNLALALKKNGDLAQAEKAYKKALALSPDDWDTWYNLGSVLFELHRFEDARKAFMTASRLNPGAGSLNSIDWYLSQMDDRTQSESIGNPRKVPIETRVNP